MLKKGKNDIYMRPVGEVFRYKDKLLEVVGVDRIGRCEKCYFKGNITECVYSYLFTGACVSFMRGDNACYFRDVKVDTAYAGDTMRAVGSYFTHNGKLLRVERPQSDDPDKFCEGCAFRGLKCFSERYIYTTGFCAGFADMGEEENIIFREVKIMNDVVDGSTSSPQEKN